MNAMRYIKLFFLSVLAAFLLVFTGCAHTENIVGNRGDVLSVYMLDIGQGDAFLLEKGGEWVLIDSGDVGHRSQIKTYLKQYGVKKLTAAIVTHPDSDHLGGMYAVFQTVPVEHLYDNGEDVRKASYKTYVKNINERHIPRTALRAGDTVMLFPAVPFHVLSPGQETFGRDDQNNNSVVGRLVYGDFSMLFTGDAEKEAELAMIARGEPLGSTVLKVGHHGSKTSTSAQFLLKVRPQAAVISAGRGNPYGHPHEVTIKKLEKVGAVVWRTDRDGTVTIRTDGKQYHISKERS